MTIICDLDGTLCSEEKTFSRCLAKPMIDAINSLNRIYQNGHSVIIFTARGWIEYEMTKDWLDKNGVMYDQLICGKPVGDMFIDDRSVQKVQDAEHSCFIPF